MTIAAHLLRGQRAEDQALRFLQAEGLTLVARNHRCRLGELDLVMRDGDCIVVTEVRGRRSGAFGGAAGSIDRAKQRRLVRATEHFLSGRPELADCPVRFDVVAITGQHADLKWIRDAFHLEY